MRASQKVDYSPETENENVNMNSREELLHLSLTP